LWNTTTRARVTQLPVSNGDPVGSLAFSPAGTLLAVDTIDGTLQLWNIGRPEPVIEFVRTGWSFAFSPDGMILAVGDGNDVSLWDVATGQQFSTLPVPVGNSDDRGAGIAPNISGGLLAVASPDDASEPNVQLWDLPYLSDLAAYLCKLAGQPFPLAEWRQYAQGLPYAQTCP
jgi:WD40 repeat protein